MKITIKNGVILSDSKKHIDAKGIVKLQYADQIAAANGLGTAENFVKKHEGRTFVINKELKIVEHVNVRGEVAAPKVRLAGTVRENGKYAFTEDDKKDIAMRLANRQVDKGIVDDEKRSAMSEYKDQLDRISLEINKLSRNLIDGYEFRDFECHVEINWAENTKSFIDVKDGHVVAVRALAPSDYQLSMDMQTVQDKKVDSQKEVDKK